VPAITQNLPTRIVAKSLLCMTATFLVALAALVLAGSAHAAEPVEPVSETPVVGTEPVEPVSETPVVGTEPVEPVSETPVVGTEPVEPVSETPVVSTEPVEPVSETPVVGTEPVEPVSETPVATAESVAEPIQEAPTPSAEPVKEAVAPVESIAEQTEELATPGKPSAEQATEAPTPPGASQGTGTPTNPASSVAGETSGSLIVAFPTGPSGGGPGEPPTGSGASAIAAFGALTRMTAAQRAGELRCELSGQASPLTENCSAAWLGRQSLLLASPDNLAMAAPGTAVAPAGAGGDVGYTGGSRSFIPSPGPSPSGAFGGSAAGGSGVATSGFFTLAGLLLLAGPRALRRLRLSCEPWLTAFFVLIPERPG
jgi:hypothetical protein